jgi:RNA 2',3'-cyclic 3'-phosphodiesterase
LRVFLAIPANPAWVASAAALVGRLQATLPRASWTRPESWHLTLKFLGEIPEEAATRFALAIGPAALLSPEGDLSAAGAILLLSRGRPRVLGVGFAAHSSAFEPLENLARIAEEAGRLAGIPPSHRAFRPHVTLARIRDPWDPVAVESFRTETDHCVFPAWPVRSCVLYRSRLQPSGAVHTPLEEWMMAASSPGVRA